MSAGGIQLARMTAAVGLLVMLVTSFASAQEVAAPSPATAGPGASTHAEAAGSTGERVATERSDIDASAVDRPLQRNREQTLDRARESSSGSGGQFVRIVLALAVVLLLIFALKWLGAKLVPGIATNRPA